MKQPSIFLCMPQSYGISETIANHLRLYGFQVYDLTIPPDKTFRRPNLSERLEIQFRKKFLHQNNAKDDVIFRNNSNEIRQKHEKILTTLRRVESVDYALFIRGDLYDDELIHAIRAKTSERIVNYQWDGLSRYPEIYSKLALFDRNYVFDPKDMGQGNPYNLFPTTNFWFEHVTVPNEFPTDCYFVGAHFQNLQRDKALVNFAKYADKQGMNSDISVYHIHGGSAAHHTELYPSPNIQAPRYPISYNENLRRMLQSKLLVDFKIPAHSGLSFRAFEALGYEKKLVTTNEKIAEYDFYHPNNIFIWDGENTEDLGTFIAKPYQPLDESIRQKYSFGNWVRYVLDMPPYQAITLPEINTSS